MGAKNKLNASYINGALVVAGMIAFVSSKLDGVCRRDGGVARHVIPCRGHSSLAGKQSARLSPNSLNHGRFKLRWLRECLVPCKHGKHFVHFSHQQKL